MVWNLEQRIYVVQLHFQNIQAGWKQLSELFHQKYVELPTPKPINIKK